MTNLRVPGEHQRTWPTEGRSLVLSRLEENGVAQAAQAVGLDPQEFEWRTRPPERGESSPRRRIIHKPTGSYLEFRLNSHGTTGHWLDWSPMFPSGKRYMSATTWAAAGNVTRLRACGGWFETALMFR